MFTAGSQEVHRRFTGGPQEVHRRSSCGSQETLRLLVPALPLANLPYAFCVLLARSPVTLPSKAL